MVASLFQETKFFDFIRVAIQNALTIITVMKIPIMMPISTNPNMDAASPSNISLNTFTAISTTPKHIKTPTTTFASKLYKGNLILIALSTLKRHVTKPVLETKIKKT
jgi:hypothetical protein